MPVPHVARQYWLRAPGQGEIVTTELPPRADAQVVVRTAFSAVSRGTETLVHRGEVPASQYDAMRAPFQEGDFPAPVKYGYSSVGVVEEGPSDLLGQSVFCLYPHQDRYVVPPEAVHLVPDTVPPGRAVLAANMETAVNVLWDARPTIGDTVVVVGAGVVGLLVATLCRDIPGVRLTVVDPNESRATVASRLGLSHREAMTPEASADVVIHASGQPEGLQSAVAAAGREGTVVEASWYGTRDVTLALGEGFHARRLSIKSSQVGAIPPARTSRWTHATRMELALTLLCDERLDALINSESTLDELPAVMDRLSGAPSDTLCHRIRYV